MEVYLEKKQVKLRPRQAIGKGGEADIYDIGNGKALKLFKQPDHPDYRGFPLEQKNAVERLKIHQKKLKTFPRNLPANVVVPEELATDKSGQQIIGYSMRHLTDTEVLNRYAQPVFRQAGISHETIVRIFLDLHKTVNGLHRSGVVIGDFNDLNVLVDEQRAFLIDSDSFQFGHFLCQVFTTRFVDPLLCISQNGRLMLSKAFQKDSDWYAFTVMAMLCLLFVDPYGGIYRPKDRTKRVAQELRPLQRITVFNPEVRYPRPAIPFQTLPDELLHYFHQVFEKDRRGEFPERLIADLGWQTCPNCRTEHARSQCPDCARAAPVAIKSVTRIRGQVTADRIFRTTGQILFAAFQADRLHWLSYENQQFKREDGSTVMSGQLDPRMRFRLKKQETLIGYRGVVVHLSKEGQVMEKLATDGLGTLPVFDANLDHSYLLQNGRLLRSGHFGPEHVGDVLTKQTLFWVGPQFGFGFYRAGGLNVAFVFDAKHSGIDDRVKLNPLAGQLLDSSCTFSHDYCWFFAVMRERGRTVFHCAVIRADGSIVATMRQEAEEAGWLSTVRGKFAVGRFLLAATDEGIVRVEVENGRIVKTREFPDTEPFVNAGCHLLAGHEGIYVIDRQEINHLKIR